MSHIVKQKSGTKITDLSLLEAAVKKLGGTLVRNQTSATYYAGRKAKCDHAITFPGTSYEIGVTKNKDGEYELQADLYCATLRKLVSSSDPNKVGYGQAQCDKLFERYGVAKLNKVARARGHRVQSETRLPDGRVQLVYQVPG